jgi:hypothetical protein
MVLNFLKKIFRNKIKNNESKEPMDITIGQRDAEGFAQVFKNGEATGLKMLVFTQEQIEKFWEAGDPDYKANKRENKINKILGEDE